MFDGLVGQVLDYSLEDLNELLAGFLVIAERLLVQRLDVFRAATVLQIGFSLQELAEVIVVELLDVRVQRVREHLFDFFIGCPDHRLHHTACGQVFRVLVVVSSSGTLLRSHS